MANRYLGVDETSPLYYNGHPIVIPDDSCGGMARLNSHNWEEPQFKFFREQSSALSHGSKPDFTLIDIGANVGLFTRQALIHAPNIDSVYAYEPDKNNWNCATFNLRPWATQVRLIRAGLSNEEAQYPLYRDETNCGNYSFIDTAMRENFDITYVQVLDIREQVHFWANRRHVFWKSDVQGMDEGLAGLAGPEFWSKCVFAGIIELWRIQKPGVALDRFREILDMYELRLCHAGRQVTTGEVFEYLAGDDYTWDDLLLSKEFVPA